MLKSCFKRELCRDAARHITTEYLVRTAMEAVYTLLDIDRGVPEVFGSAYDIRVLLEATAKMMDEEKLTDLHLPLLGYAAIKKLDNSRVLQLITEYGLLEKPATIYGISLAGALSLKHKQCRF